MRITGLWKLPDETDWLRIKLGLGLMEGAMLSKSLVQFSVDGWGRVPSLFFDLWPNSGGGKEHTGGLLQKVFCMHCCTQCPQTCSRPPLAMPLLKTPGHWWASLGQSLVGSLVLSPGFFCAQGLFVHSKSLFLLSCVGSGSSVVELIAASSKRAYAIWKSTAPRAPAPVAVHCSPILLQETLRHNSGLVSFGSLGPGAHKKLVCTLSVVFLD